MPQHFLVFGNHPALSLAEFSALFPTAKVHVQSRNGIVFEMDGWDGEITMNTLGGIIKLGDVLRESDGLALKADDIAELMTKDLNPTGLEFGWTVFGSLNRQKQVFAKYPIHVKKALKELGWKVRWVTGKGGDISPAAVAKCKLTERPNFDACLFLDKGKAILGRTTDVQDADAWSLRDYGRPRRDDANGMLPPKLARIMVNLAQVADGGTLLDPFCGSGTVLMEAALATKAKKIIGSDIDAKQIADTNANTEWLAEKNIVHPEDMKRFNAFVSDAKVIDRHLEAGSIDGIVTEGWLGRLLKGRESEHDLRANAKNIQETWAQSLPALRKVLKPKGRLVAVIPSFKHNKTIIDPQTNLDFASFGFKRAILPYGLDSKELYYEREGQHLRRNIVVLEKGSQD